MSKAAEKASEKPSALSAEELDAWADLPVTEEVRIGKRTVKIQGIRDSSRLAQLDKIGKARKAFPVEVAPGESVTLAEGEAMLFTWLEAGAVDPPLTYQQIVQISRRAGIDCVMAAQRVVELSDQSVEGIDEAKNGSREDATANPDPSRSESPMLGENASSRPAS